MDDLDYDAVKKMAEDKFSKSFPDNKIGANDFYPETMIGYFSIYSIRNRGEFIWIMYEFNPQDYSIKLIL